MQQPDYTNITHIIELRNQEEVNDHLAHGWRLLSLRTERVTDDQQQTIYVLGLPRPGSADPPRSLQNVAPPAPPVSSPPLDMAAANQTRSKTPRRMPRCSGIGDAASSAGISASSAAAVRRSTSSFARVVRYNCAHFVPGLLVDQRRMDSWQQLIIEFHESTIDRVLENDFQIPLIVQFACLRLNIVDPPATSIQFPRNRQIRVSPGRIQLKCEPYSLRRRGVIDYERGVNIRSDVTIGTTSSLPSTLQSAPASRNPIC